MNKVENQCTTCDGLGWYVSQFCNVIACRECRMFEHDNEAFKFVTTTCEHWQRTIALIFATRLIAEAVPVPPIEEIPEPQEFKDARREKGTSLTLVCSKCGAAFGCCDHKGVDMVDPNTRPFIDKRKEHIANYVAPLWPANVHIPTEQEFKEKRILREVDAERISELPASIAQTKQA